MFCFCVEFVQHILIVLGERCRCRLFTLCRLALVQVYFSVAGSLSLESCLLNYLSQFWILSLCHFRRIWQIFWHWFHLVYLSFVCYWLCIGSDAAYIILFFLRCWWVRVILHDFLNVFVWGAHFCKVVRFCRCCRFGCMRSSSIESVFIKRICFLLFFSSGDGSFALWEIKFSQAFLSPAGYWVFLGFFFSIFVKITSLGSLCRNSTCLVASAVWPVFIAKSRVKSVSDSSFSWRRKSFVLIIIMFLIRLSLESFNSHS